MFATTRAATRVLALGFAVVVFGCGKQASQPTTAPAPNETPTPAPGAPEHASELQKERNKLSPEDRALVQAQEWCVISQEERLGEMGPPIKLMIKDQPVFICCKGCKRKAEADPDKTLAAVAELKKKAEAERAKPTPH